MGEYPVWSSYPASTMPEQWMLGVVGAFRDVADQIDSGTVDGLTSDKVLAAVRPGLEALGYEVEAGKRADQKIRRPVLFGERGAERVAYEVDAVHDDLGIVVEVEAGRGAQSNALYRDLVRASLIVGADYLVLGMMAAYRHQSAGRTVTVDSYAAAKEQLDAIYASGRLQLPFKGILLIGY